MVERMLEHPKITAAIATSVFIVARFVARKISNRTDRTFLDVLRRVCRILGADIPIFRRIGRYLGLKFFPMDEP